jgi:hypothetical protein
MLSHVEQVDVAGEMGSRPPAAEHSAVVLRFTSGLHHQYDLVLGQVTITVGRQQHTALWIVLRQCVNFIHHQNSKERVVTYSTSLRRDETRF